MNEKLIYKDGKALIISDDNKIKEIDYYDNLNKVLQKENLIEKLNAKIFNLEEEVYDDEEKIHSKNDILTLLAVVMSSPIVGYVLFDYVLDLEKVVYTTLFGDIKLINLITIIGIPIVALCGGIALLPMLVNNNELKWKLNGKKTSIKYLKKELEKAKEELLELKKDKGCSKNNENMYVLSINDDIKNEEIKNNFDVYYNLGYYQKKNQKKKSDSTICYPLLYGEVVEDDDKDLPKRRIKKR